MAPDPDALMSEFLQKFNETLAKLNDAGLPKISASIKQNAKGELYFGDVKVRTDFDANEWKTTIAQILDAGVELASKYDLVFAGNPKKPSDNGGDDE